jgi:hypothetical protein
MPAAREVSHRAYVFEIGWIRPEHESRGGADRCHALFQRSPCLITPRCALHDRSTPGSLAGGRGDWGALMPRNQGTGGLLNKWPFTAFRGL